MDIVPGKWQYLASFTYLFNIIFKYPIRLHHDQTAALESAAAYSSYPMTGKLTNSFDFYH